MIMVYFMSLLWSLCFAISRGEVYGRVLPETHVFSCLMTGAPFMPPIGILLCTNIPVYMFCDEYTPYQAPSQSALHIVSES